MLYFNYRWTAPENRSNTIFKTTSQPLRVSPPEGPGAFALPLVTIITVCSRFPRPREVWGRGQLEIDPGTSHLPQAKPSTTELHFQPLYFETGLAKLPEWPQTCYSPASDCGVAETTDAHHHPSWYLYVRRPFLLLHAHCTHWSGRRPQHSSLERLLSSAWRKGHPYYLHISCFCSQHILRFHIHDYLITDRVEREIEKSLGQWMLSVHLFAGAREWSIKVE